MQKNILHGAKSPKIQYVLLAIICAATMLYHARLAQDVLHNLSEERADIPHFGVSMNDARLYDVRPDALAAGLHNDDVLLAINGHPYSGRAVLEEELAKAKPGTPLIVKVQSTVP